MLILRASNKKGQAYRGFQWPLEVGAIVKAPDWDPKPVCGYGLHGLAWGCGDFEHLNLKGRWYIVEADDASIVDLGGKVKFPECVVRLVTENRDEAIAYLEANGAADKPVVFARRVVGDYQMVTVGDCGTATAGIGGTATAGNQGTATARIRGTATAGVRGTATAGNYGNTAAGDYGNATTGDEGTATAGDYGNATAGDYGNATAGRHSIAIAGDYGTSIVGAGGKASTGIGGQIIVRYWVDLRPKTAVFYEGKDYEAGITYKLIRNKDMVLVEA